MTLSCTRTADHPQGSVKKSEKTPLWTKDFVLGTVVNFIIAANYFMLMVVMTAYAMDIYHAPASAAAFCASVFIIGTLISRLLSAPLMDRFGRKILLIISVVLELALTATYLLPIHLPVLILVRFLHGFCYGVCSTTIATVVTSIVPASRKGEGIGYYMLSVTLGSAIGPFIGVFVSRNVSYETLFIIAGVILALAVPTIIAMSTREQHKRTKKSATADIIAAEDEIAGDLSDAPVEQKREEKAARDAEFTARLEDRKAKPNGFAAWISRYVELSVIPISLVSGIVFFGYSSILTFLTPYSVEIGLSRAASVFFVVYALSIFVTRPFTGRAFDRRGARPVTIPAFFAVVIGMVMIACSTNDWLLLGSALVLGYGVGTIQSCGLSFAVKITPDERISLANATYYILVDAGVGIGPLILGIIVPLIGYRAMYVTMALLGIVAFFLFLIVSKAKKTTP